jgi:hypothetical protein
MRLEYLVANTLCNDVHGWKQTVLTVVVEDHFVLFSRNQQDLIRV